MESRQPPPINGGLNQQYPPEAALGAEPAFDPQQNKNVIRLFRPSDSNRRRPKRSIRAYANPIDAVFQHRCILFSFFR
jgi:hypothetical protein